MHRISGDAYCVAASPLMLQALKKISCAPKALMLLRTNIEPTDWLRRIPISILIILRRKIF